MIAAALLGLSLVVNVSFEPNDLTPNAEAKATAQMSPRQKLTTLRPLIRSATQCVLHAVTADPRYRATLASADMNELIVASMAPCADAMRSMIDAHDRLFGEGSGETFFMGPYLDGLPLTIDKMVKDGAAPTGDPVQH
jgi:hypothetical protein